MHHYDPKPSNRNRFLQTIALGLSAAAVTGCGITGDRQPTPAPNQTQSSIEAEKTQEIRAYADFQRQGKEAALAIADLMADTDRYKAKIWWYDEKEGHGAGTGWKITNNAYVDNLPGDAPYTYLSASYNHGTESGDPPHYGGLNLWGFRAHKGESETITSVRIGVDIPKSSEFAKKSENPKTPPTVEDLREILQEIGDGSGSIMYLEGSVETSQKEDERDKGASYHVGCVWEERCGLGFVKGTVAKGDGLDIDELNLDEYTANMADQVDSLNNKALSNLRD